MACTMTLVLVLYTSTVSMTSDFVVAERPSGDGILFRACEADEIRGKPVKLSSCNLPRVKCYITVLLHPNDALVGPVGRMHLPVPS